MTSLAPPQGALAPPRRSRGPVRIALDALWAVFPAWVLARVGVAISYGIAHLLLGHVHHGTGGLNSTSGRVHQGIFGWDAGWYATIGAHGYAAAGRPSLRFFPLFPMTIHALLAVPGMKADIAGVLIANLCALVAAALLYHLVILETGDAAMARFSSWLFLLAPSAFVFVMGYSEPLFLVLAIGALWALRRQRFWIAAGLALLAGATRPFGVMISLAALVESARVVWERRSLKGLSFSGWSSRIASMAAAPLGTAAYFGWVDWRFGNFLLPVKVQLRSKHHGGFADPFATAIRDLNNLVHLRHLGLDQHLFWAVVAVVLVVVTFFKLPWSWGSYAAGVIGLSLASSTLSSFERYALTAFPIVVAMGFLFKKERSRTVVLVASGLAMIGYCALAFLNLYVP
jgi:hypothetical protein